MQYLEVNEFRSNSRVSVARASPTVASVAAAAIDLPLRPTSVMQAAETAKIPDVPIILFMGRVPLKLLFIFLNGFTCQVFFIVLDRCWSSPVFTPFEEIL